MARDVLTATFIKSAPVGKHCDGDKLFFHRRKDGATYFFLRYTLHSKRKELHLGRVSVTDTGQCSYTG